MRSFYSPLAISAPFYGNLKLLKLHRTERSRNKEGRSGNRTQDLLHEGRALTDCAILASEEKGTRKNTLENGTRKFGQMTTTERLES